MGENGQSKLLNSLLIDLLTISEVCNEDETLNAKNVQAKVIGLSFSNNLKRLLINMSA